MSQEEKVAEEQAFGRVDFQNALPIFQSEGCKRYFKHYFLKATGTTKNMSRAVVP